MAFDELKYRMRCPYPITLTGSSLSNTYTTANAVKSYTPGQIVETFDPLYGYRIFKLVKNLSGSTITQGKVVSYVNPATVGTITEGSTTSITTSGLTANDLEWQIINITDDAGGAGAAPEGESSLCIGNTTTHIELHPDYPLSVAVGASDTAYVIYQNGIELAASGDYRGPGSFTNSVAGVAYGAVADNYWCWICQKGWVVAAADDSSAVVAGDICVGSASGYVLALAATSTTQELAIGQAATTQNAATANTDTFVLMYIDVFTSVHLQTTP